ncbi:YcdB/YcdC domain-containing protein [Methanolobus sp. ZRKC2]|uniref:YcdB/YcdC domain-containing protein n=1 Tax=Methanolobus sp. ZRKC2 TaxID=3125783 RepID=UPI00324B84B4
MKIMRVLILGLLLSSAIFVAFASEEGATIFTKEDVKQTKYLDQSTMNVDITLEDVKANLLSENPEIISESIDGELIDKDKFGVIWQVSAKTINEKSIVMGIDASNGELVFVYDGSKSVRGVDKISEKEALSIAEEYVQSKVSNELIDTIELEKVNYREPVAADLAGVYKVDYARLINGIHSLDGIQIRVNAETGEVSTYRKTWSIDSDKVTLVDTKPSITNEESVEILKKYMSNIPQIGEEKAETVNVTSSMLSWKEDNDEIHLAWRIQFQDSTFVADDSSSASAWIDAHSGNVILFDYERD